MTELEEGKLKFRTYRWAENRLSHAAAVAAANWDRPQVYVAEIKGTWTKEILEAQRDREIQNQVLSAFRKDLPAVPAPVLERMDDSPAHVQRPSLTSTVLSGRRTAEVPGRPRSRLHTGSGAGPRPMQNNFVVSAGRKGNFAWAAQRLSRAAALAARHWQNPKAYREGLSGNRDPEDLRDEEVQIQVLGAMGGHSLEHSLRQTAVMNSEIEVFDFQ
mmetsp:Transcript_34333/g.80107  ORF Transcript_34333/g.80107 Transcript_34333/m.80107 type:complete len:216 (+) Transcript_34333:36-683(+)